MTVALDSLTAAAPSPAKGSARAAPIGDPHVFAARFNALYRTASPEEILAAAYEAFGDELAVVSSFGAESAALLDVVAAVDPAMPVVFLETGRHFAETLAYRDRLIADLGLTGVRAIRPDAAEKAAEDPDDTLAARDTDACCALRKVRPLAGALKGLKAWVTGRKRFQTAGRIAMPVAEVDAEGRVKINPLAALSPAAVEARVTDSGLPPHPLVAQGYPSIGCAPCTSPVADGEDPRAGRWRGAAKTECGIHITPDGRIERVTRAA